MNYFLRKGNSDFKGRVLGLEGEVIVGLEGRNFVYSGVFLDFEILWIFFC